MPDAARTHALRAVEELLRAGAELCASAREPRSEDAEPSPLEHAAVELLELVQNHGAAVLVPLLVALRAEHARWAARADDDEAAARVRDLFAWTIALVERSPTGKRRDARGAPPESSAAGERGTKRRGRV